MSSGTGPLNDTIIFSRRDLRTVEDILSFKYSFTNKMGITLRTRHYWSKVAPQQFYQLAQDGKLGTPVVPFTQNVNQNYNSSVPTSCTPGSLPRVVLSCGVERYLPIFQPRF